MKKLRCIIADDEPLALRLIETYVQRTPALEPVGSYTSAKEALQAIGDGRADLAFLDIQMPQMSGLELATHSRGGQSSSPQLSTAKPLHHTGAR